MEYYYTPPEKVSPEGNKLEIDEFEYRHLVKVLRKREGDVITVTDGQLNIYECIITGIYKDKLTCDIREKKRNLYEPATHISLFLSPLRNSDRFEFAVEKAVELGAYSIHPVISEHTVNKTALSGNKLERLRKIIIGAMGQSQRCLLPVLHETVTFDEMLAGTGSFDDRIVMYEFAEGSRRYEHKPRQKVALLIGPEGGFSKTEIEKLKNNNWQVLSLGERKLRAETAAIVSVFDILK